MFRKITTLLFFILISILYLHNLTRDIYSGDIGDLVTAACVGGVAHPPGYPLFTLIGNFLCSLPIPIAPVSKVALLSTFASLLGLYIFYRFAQEATRNTFISLLTTLTLAFSYLYWFHAEIPEAFGLNNLFAILLLYLSYLFYQTRKMKYLYLLAFFIGLSLTHHHTILLLYPTVGLLVIYRIKTVWKYRKTLPKIFGFFLLGIAVYLYVPLASSQNPLINWGSVQDLQGFAHLLQRKAYGGFAPSVNNGIPIGVKTAITRDYFNTLISNFSYQLIFVAILGFIHLFRRDKRLLAALFLGFCLAGPFFVFYAATFYTTVTSVGIIERFYGMSFVVLMFFVPYGFLLLKRSLDRVFSRSLYSLLIIGYFLIVPALMLYYNFPRTDLSKTRIGNNLSRDILASLPQNSILYVSGDTTSFNMWYAQYVLKLRPDVDLINPPGVGGNRFLDDEINAFHQKNPHIPLQEILNKTLNELRLKRPIFATYEIRYRPKSSLLLPKGLVYELINTEDLPSQEEYIRQVEQNLGRMHRVRMETLTPAERNLVATEIPLIYSNALVRTGDFLDSWYKNPGGAEQYYRRALWIHPESPSAYAGLGLVLFKAYNDCKQSLQSFDQAIDIYPIWETYYVQRYTIAERCNIGEKRLKKLKEEYKKTFNEDRAF